MAIRDEHGELWVDGDDALLDVGLAERREKAKACGAKCDTCALGKSSHGPVAARMRPGARALFIVEQPNEEDVSPGTLYENGRVGDEFYSILEKSQATPDEYSIVPVQLCAWDAGMRAAWQTRESAHAKAVKAAKKAGETLPQARHGILPADACRPRYVHDVARAVGASDEELAQATGTLPPSAAPVVAAKLKVIAAKVTAEATTTPEGPRPYVVQPMGYGALTPAAQVFGIPHGMSVAAAGEVKITRLDKQLLTAVAGVDKPIVVPNYSLGYSLVQGNRQWRPFVEVGITRAFAIARRGRVDWTPPTKHTLPTVDQIESILGGFIERWKGLAHRKLGRAWIACDIETTGLERDAKILCIGFAQRQANGEIVSIAVPIRRRLQAPDPEKGKRIDHSLACAPWPWTPDEQRRIREIIRRVFSEGGVTGHNFVQFDRGQLARAGWLGAGNEVWERLFYDTLIQDRNTPNGEIDHSLVRACATRFEVIAWKDDANDKATIKGSGDESLHDYCQYDCANQLVLTERQEDEIYTHSSVDQHHTDHAGGPVYANMNEIGLPVSKAKYDLYTEKLGKARKEELQKLRELVGSARRADNATAMSEVAAATWEPTPANVRDYLFDFCKVTPIVGTGPKKPAWEPGLLPAVDSISFSRILEERDLNGTPAKAFINAMYEFRAVDKLLSTYLVGLTKTRHEPGCWGHSLVEWENVPGFADPLWMLHPVYRLAIPTGRVSTSPTIQNWPERTRAGINMRALIEAPPGHVFVGADLEQVELRIYAIVSGDQEMLEIFSDPSIDAHAWNYATISVPNPSDKDSVRRMHDHVVRLKNSTSAKDQKEAKKLRNIAKRFCLAEGTRVLTEHRGEVPIEDVLITDRVWDGVEWVSHQGVVCNGEKEVIEYDGIEATDDHTVWVTDGRQMSLGDAARQGLPLATTSRDGLPLRYVDDDKPRLARAWTSKTDRMLHWMWRNFDTLPGQSDVRKEYIMPPVCAEVETTSACVAASAMQFDEVALHQHKASKLAGLWRAGSGVSIFKRRRRSNLDYVELGTPSRNGNRPNKQRWALRARKSAVCNTSDQYNESPQHEAERGLDVQLSGVAVRGEACKETSVSRVDTRTDFGTRLGGSTRKVTVQGTQANQGVVSSSRKVKVYDLINAGPRHRFTANGKLVHNCYLITYGGEPDKLFATMAADRDKITFELNFPGITPEQTQKWYDAWHRIHPETKRWQNRCVEEAKTLGSVAGIGDYRRRFFFGGLNKRNAAANATIQGSAAFIANRAVVNIAELIRFRSWSHMTGLVLQVHDYIGAFVPVKYAEYAYEVFKREMPWSYKGMDFGIDAKVSTSWAFQ